MLGYLQEHNRQLESNLVQLQSDFTTRTSNQQMENSNKLAQQAAEAASKEILLKSTLEQQYQQRMTLIQGEVASLREAVRAAMNQGILFLR